MSLGYSLLTYLFPICFGYLKPIGFQNIINIYDAIKSDTNFN